MSRSKACSFLILFLCLVQSSFSQGSRWYVDAGAKVSLVYFTERGFNSIGDYTPSSSEQYYFVDENVVAVNASLLVFYKLGGGYEITPWLNGHLSIAYAPQNEAGSGLRTAGSGFTNGMGVLIKREYIFRNSAWEFVPSVRLDLLANSKYEDFSFIVGFGYGLINWETALNSQGRINEDPVNQELIWDRQVEYLKLNLGIEWRDYFSPKFGYFLRLNAAQGLFANTRKIKVQEFRLDDTAQPLEGQGIKPGQDAYPEEKHEIIFGEFEIGLTYQF